MVEYNKIVDAQQEITRKIREYEDMIIALNARIIMDAGGNIYPDKSNESVYIHQTYFHQNECTEAIEHILSSMEFMKKIAIDANWIEEE